jgi:hypothetical protein
MSIRTSALHSMVTSDGFYCAASITVCST